MKIPLRYIDRGVPVSSVRDDYTERTVYQVGEPGSWRTYRNTPYKYYQYRSGKRSGKQPGSTWKIPTPYLLHVSEVYEVSESHSYWNRNGSRTERHNHFAQFFSGSFDRGLRKISTDSQMSTQAGIEAVQKLSQGDFNLGVALAESSETLGFIADNTVKLVQIIRHARRGRWSSIGKLLGYKGWTDTKGTANKWLEYQYGLMPLISDIYGATETLKTGFKEKDQTLKAVRVRKRTGHLSGNNAYLKLHDNGNSSSEYSIRVVLHARISKPGLAAAASLGLTNPALIAWELVPFSFVIDWLLPIGDFLEACSAIHGLDFVSGTETIRETFDVTFCTDQYWDSDEFTDPAFFRTRGLTVSRSVLTKWPLAPPLYWKNPFSTSHAATATALVRQLKK